MLTSEPPLDLSRDRTISVRPDSYRRLPHTIAGFEPTAFLGAHSRQRNQGCSHAETSSTSRNSYLAADTMPEAVRNWLLQNVFNYTPTTTWVYQLMRLLARALLLNLIPIIGISPLQYAVFAVFNSSFYWSPAAVCSLEVLQDIVSCNPFSMTAWCPITNHGSAAPPPLPKDWAKLLCLGSSMLPRQVIGC